MITVREALRDAMAEQMRLDNNVLLLGEEVGQYQGAYKVSQGLLDEFGDKRVIDTPITEHGFAGMAVGMAMAGLKPIVEFMTFNFSLQAVDHIINSAAKTYYMSGGTVKCPIVFRGPNGAAARVGAQHSQNFAALYSHIPGLKVIAPYNAADSKALLIQAIQDPNPVVFLEHEMMYGNSFEEEESDAKIGKAKIVIEGNDITIVSFSKQMDVALQTAEKLKEDGISAEVIDLLTIRPIDKECLISSVKKTNRMLVIEEGWFFAGVGSSIMAIVQSEAFDYLDAPVEVLCGKDVPMPYAENLEKLTLPSVKEAIEKAKQLCYK